MKLVSKFMQTPLGLYMAEPYSLLSILHRVFVCGLVFVLVFFVVFDDFLVEFNLCRLAVFAILLSLLLHFFYTANKFSGSAVCVFFALIWFLKAPFFYIYFIYLYYRAAFLIINKLD